MIKKFFIIFILFMFAACTKAKVGEEGGKCLPGNLCSQEGLRCDENSGRCFECGRNGIWCCQGSKCGKLSVCTEDGFCESCGFEGKLCCQSEPKCINSICAEKEICEHCGKEYEICCPDKEVGCDRGFCNEIGICVSSVCDKNGDCSGCGSPLAPCCEGERCNEISICNEENYCEPCGSMHEQPCPTNRCRGWLTVVKGVCDIPFVKNKPISISACENSYEGYEDKSQKDWCLWYAAYFSNNSELCNSIVWEEAKAHCLRNKNPDDFYVKGTIKFK